MALIGKIIAMTGVATVQNEKGDKRALHPGDQIQTGDSIQTTAGVDVDVQLANGRVIHIGSDQMVAFTPELAEVFAPTEADSAVNVATIDTVIQAIQDGRDINQVLEETAAGGAGGSDGSHSALYLERINQTLNTFGFEDDGASPDQLLLANGLGNLVPFVGDITPDTEAEGAVLVHTVTLTNILGTPQTFAFSVVGNTATAGEDFTSGFTFSNGVTFTPIAGNPFVGTITVPANVGTFTVSIQTNNDTVFEGNETYTINVGGESAIGTIVDNESAPTVTDVDPGNRNASGEIVGATVIEGNPLTFTVTLSNASSTPTTVNLSLNGTNDAKSADLNADIGRTLLVTFNDGTTQTVTLAADNTFSVSVPALNSTFVVSVPTLPDNIVEGEETLTMSAGTAQNVTPVASAPGTILDAVLPPTVTDVDPGNRNASGEIVGATVIEGNPLTFTVTLSNASSTPTTVNLSLNGTNDAKSADLNADIGRTLLVTFNDGTTQTVTLAADNTFSVSVPALNSTFVVSVPTLPDNIVEGEETLTMSAGTAQNVTPVASAPGTILDGTDPQIVTGVTRGSSTALDPNDGQVVGSRVVEGDASEPLSFTVTLNVASKFATEVNLTLAGDGNNPATILGAAADINRTMQITFNNGITNTVTLNDDGTFKVSVPPLATSFVVSMATNEDSLPEEMESLRLTASTAQNPLPYPSAIGEIIDIAVTQVTAGVETPDGDTNGAVVIEGNDLQFKVDLNTAAVKPTTVNLVLTSVTGTVGTDTAPTGDKKVTVISSDGRELVVTETATGLSVVVPAGVSSFIVKVPTIVDNVYEEPETIRLNAGTDVQLLGNSMPDPATGRIFDVDGFVQATGLSGQYFGYNDNGVSRSIGNSLGDNRIDIGNLNSVQDVTTIINLRNQAAGGSNTIVGTNNSAERGAADVYFKATEINYNPNSAFTNNLGGNDNVAAATGSNSDPNIGAGSLRTFLTNDNGDQESARVDAGLANTTDAIIRLTGKIFLERGNYDFRVLADDGFSLRVNGKTLIEYDGNQAPTSRDYNNLYLDDATSGLTDIELLYWEQGREGVLRIEYKLSSETEYKMLSLDNLPMFSNDDMKILPDLDDTQDIVSNGSGGYIIRSGEKIFGTVGAETLEGTLAKDEIYGLDGVDILRGLEGADTLYGGAGNDRLEGGAGNDELDGGTGADTMIGGTGDDLYIVDNAGDIVTEAFNEGTDTIVFSESYNVGTYDISVGIENVEIKGAQDVTVNGNGANNRIVGGAGNDALLGGNGNDIVIGGRGSDTLSGDEGNDVFVWRLGDHVGAGVPEDVITDFKYTGNGTGNAQSVKTDSIDLRDLLQGEQSSLVDFNGGANPENLLNFLNFSVDGTSTVINVSTTGGFASGGNGVVDQKIVLQDVNLFTATGSGTGAGLNDQTLLLQKILANGTLIVD